MTTDERICELEHEMKKVCARNRYQSIVLVFSGCIVAAMFVSILNACSSEKSIFNNADFKTIRAKEVIIADEKGQMRIRLSAKTKYAALDMYDDDARTKMEFVVDDNKPRVKIGECLGGSSKITIYSNAEESAITCSGASDLRELPQTITLKASKDHSQIKQTNNKNMDLLSLFAKTGSDLVMLDDKGRQRIWLQSGGGEEALKLGASLRLFDEYGHIKLLIGASREAKDGEELKLRPESNIRIFGLKETVNLSPP